jgi:hypothetical protein
MLSGLLIVFLLLPIALVCASVHTPPPVRFGILFVGFPVGLLAFALWRHLRSERGAAAHGDDPPRAAGGGR